MRSPPLRLAPLALGVALLAASPAPAAPPRAAPIPRLDWTAEQVARAEEFRRQVVGHPLLASDPLARAEASFALWDRRLALEPAVVARFARNPERDARERRITYAQYRQRIGLPGKIRQAPGFFDRHRAALERTERESGVSRHVLAAVIGIESEFGRLSSGGGYRAADALLSQFVLSPDPRRRRFAVNEMAHLLVLRRRLGVDLLSIRSSYAGAIGHAQGIPSSLNRFFQGDLSSMEDSIDFVARYLAHAGWKPGPSGSRRARAAIRAYNHSEHYVRAVLEIAASLERLDRSPPPPPPSAKSGI